MTPLCLGTPHPEQASSGPWCPHRPGTVKGTALQQVRPCHSPVPASVFECAVRNTLIWSLTFRKVLWAVAGRPVRTFVVHCVCKASAGWLSREESTFPRKVRVDFVLDHQRGLGKESCQTVWSVASCHEISQWTSSGSDPQHNA